MAATRRASFGLFPILGRDGAWPTCDRLRPFTVGCVSHRTTRELTRAERGWSTTGTSSSGVLWERVEGGQLTGSPSGLNDRAVCGWVQPLDHRERGSPEYAVGQAGRYLYLYLHTPYYRFAGANQGRRESALAGARRDVGRRGPRTAERIRPAGAVGVSVLPAGMWPSGPPRLALALVA